MTDYPVGTAALSAAFIAELFDLGYKLILTFRHGTEVYHGDQDDAHPTRRVYDVDAFRMLTGDGASWGKEPNFDHIAIAAPRNQVATEFGHPTTTNDLDEGKQEAIYQYEMGNSPNPGRAAMWGYAWLTIIGILGEPYTH
jgi:hypothetical protein